MYITDTTEKVRKLFEEIEVRDDISKERIILYIFNEINNDQVNSKNKFNPNLIEDEDMIIFNFDSIGYPSNYGTIFLQYNIMVYNLLTKSKDLYEDNGSVIGLKLDDEEKKILSNFEKLCFNEKLDIISEIFIRYNNETYFKNKITMVTFSSEETGFEIANKIKKMKY